jgi:hypothetical protein
MADNPTSKEVPNEQPVAASALPEAKLPHCGIIMPISDTDGYDAGHWLNVRSLIVRAAKQAGYTAGMVSENDGQDVIHRSIVKNIYHNELVVCDVSSLNPNVMLELGLRMANKKPLVVIFDGEGIYPFDIKNMLYISYPKGLHHFRIENFVQELTTRMIQVTAADKEGKYEPFLNHFNDVVIEESRLGTTTQSMVETMESLVEEVKGIKSDLQKRPLERGRIALGRRSNLDMLTPVEIALIDSVIADFVDKTGTRPRGGDKRFLIRRIHSAFAEKFKHLSPEDVDARMVTLYSAINNYLEIGLGIE